MNNEDSADMRLAWKILLTGIFAGMVAFALTTLLDSPYWIRGVMCSTAATSVAGRIALTGLARVVSDHP